MLQRTAKRKKQLVLMFSKSKYVWKSRNRNRERQIFRSAKAENFWEKKCFWEPKEEIPEGARGQGLCLNSMEEMNSWPSHADHVRIVQMWRCVCVGGKGLDGLWSGRRLVTPREEKSTRRDFPERKWGWLCDIGCPGFCSSRVWDKNLGLISHLKENASVLNYLLRNVDFLE